MCMLCININNHVTMIIKTNMNQVLITFTNNQVPMVNHKHIIQMFKQCFKTHCVINGYAQNQPFLLWFFFTFFFLIKLILQLKYFVNHFSISTSMWDPHSNSIERKVIMTMCSQYSLLSRILFTLSL